MNKEEFNSKVNIIREVFDDERNILYPTPLSIRQVDENIHQGEYVFTTETGEFIDLETQLVDFDEEELTKKVEFAESLYEKHNKHVSIYLLCPTDIRILMKECTIKSEAEFKIKLACVGEDGCELILRHVKKKIKNNTELTSDDMEALTLLPIMCKKEDRHYFRVECFKIINQLND